MKAVKEYWYLIFIGLFFLFAAGVFAVCGEGSFLAVHDNLDLFLPQYQMMKDTGTFWGAGGTVPFLGGISRDYLPSEFSLYTMLYMIFPAYTAYMAGYFLKIVIALLSSYLLAKDWFPDTYRTYRPLVWLIGFAYGILNLFPTFGICFASLPLVLFLLRRIYAAPSFRKAALWYAALFFYPLCSYFSYFGLFILAYLAVGILWLSIRNQKVCWRLAAGLVVLAAGYVVCEYRLFGQMLFSGTETIRSSMKTASLGFGQIAKEIITVWTQGIFHAESVHTWLVLPLCTGYFLILNLSYLRKKNGKGILKDIYNLLMLLLLCNSVLYGIYFWEGFRQMVETICPPLTGWQFNRTVFFNPFLWYASFFLVLKRMYDSGRSRWKGCANLLAMAGILIILLSGTRYHDLYHTCHEKGLEWGKGKVSDQLSYREFYSAELFEAAKAAIGYQQEWSVAYGFYPGVLEYNEIATLDGYLGYYSQEYKEAFRKIIAPALERVPESKAYFDDWGARAALYSGSCLSVTVPTKNFPMTEDILYMNREAFLELGGRYLFSRVRFLNPKEAGVRLLLALQGKDYDSPYMLYVYEAEGISSQK